jgi:hypothetical protein
LAGEDVCARSTVAKPDKRVRAAAAAERERNFFTRRPRSEK